VKKDPLLLTFPDRINPAFNYYRDESLLDAIYAVTKEIEVIFGSKYFPRSPKCPSLTAMLKDKIPNSHTYKLFFLHERITTPAETYLILHS